MNTRSGVHGWSGTGPDLGSAGPSLGSVIWDPASVRGNSGAQGLIRVA